MSWRELGFTNLPGRSLQSADGEGPAFVPTTGDMQVTAHLVSSRRRYDLILFLCRMWQRGRNTVPAFLLYRRLNRAQRPPVRPLSHLRIARRLRLLRQFFSSRTRMFSLAPTRHHLKGITSPATVESWRKLLRRSLALRRRRRCWSPRPRRSSFPAPATSPHTTSCSSHCASRHFRAPNRA